MLLLGETAALDAAGVALPVGGPRQRGMLALLVLHAPRVVTRAEIVDALWGAAAPGGPANAVQRHVAGLRRALGPSLVITVGDGYRLDPAVQTDVSEFERLLQVGQRLRDQGDRAWVDSLAAALALWRGPALADLSAMGFALAAAARLEELRLVAVELSLDAALVAGRFGACTAEAAALVAAHPLRESFAGLLMRALYAAGRQADALAVYARIRRRLCEELGLEPGRALQDLHRRLLTQTEPLPLSAPR